MSEFKWWRRLLGGVWYYQFNDVVLGWWARELSSPPSCGWQLLKVEDYR